MRLNIYTDGGRCCRPLYIMENNNLLISKDILQKIQNKSYGWNNLMISLNHSGIQEKLLLNKPIKEGVIEYIDTEESEYKYIARIYRT